MDDETLLINPLQFFVGIAASLLPVALGYSIIVESFDVINWLYWESWAFV